MGLGNSTERSRTLGGPSGPKSFYLVVGGPPITYRYPGQGPLIYNIDLPQDRGPQQIEAAKTVRNAVNITHKSGIRLLQRSKSDFREGFYLSFLIDAAPDVEFTLSIFANAQVTLQPSVGIVLTPAPRQGGGPQHIFKLYSESSLLRADGRGLQFKCQTPILVHDLEKIRFPEKFSLSSQTNDDDSPAYAPIVIQVSYNLMVNDGLKPEGTVRKQVFTTCLKVDPKMAESANKSVDGTPCIVVSGARSFLQIDDEIFEVNDVFDAGDGAVVGPKESAASPAPRTEGEEEMVDMSQPPTSPAAEEDDEANACVVCLTNPKDTTVMPCRHLCLCSECAAIVKHQSNKCPVCRTPIEKLLALRASSKR
jgi:hypothetical protein